MIKDHPAKVVVKRIYCNICKREMKRNKNAETVGKWGAVSMYEYRCENGHVDSSKTLYPTWRVIELKDDGITPLQ